MDATSTTLIASDSPQQPVFGDVDDVSEKYAIGREPSTKVFDVPPQFNGSFRVDDDLDPSRYMYVEIKGIHDSYYLGINQMEFYDENDDKVPYENIMVDGKDVDNDTVNPVFPTNGWWAVVGEDHSVVFDFKKVTKIKRMHVFFANAASTPKNIILANSKKMPELAKEGEDAFCSTRYFQLSGKVGIDPVDLRFRKSFKDNDTLLSLGEVTELLNSNPPCNGFESLLTHDGENLFVFYAKGLHRQATDYYFGSNSNSGVKLANSTMKSSGVTINDAAQRAMTLEELFAVRAIILSKCVDEKWTSTDPNHKGKQLRPTDVSLYDLNAVLVMPSTMDRNCSFKELFSSGDSTPTYYVSHWWGEKVLDFIRCCEYHARMNNIDPSEAKYWVCAYANRQHDLGSDLGSDPRKSSFSRAMRLAKGVLLVVDPYVTVVSRIWVDYELYWTINAESDLDVALYNEGRVKLMTDRKLPLEQSSSRYLRHRQFPFDQVIDAFLTLQLHQGIASMNVDKVRILNVMSGRTANLEDDQILVDCLSDDADNDLMKKFAKVDNTLRARIASPALRTALSEEGQGITNFHGHDLINILIRSSSRTFDSDKFDLVGSNLTDEDFLHIASTFSTMNDSADTFLMNVGGCKNLTDSCITQMTLSSQILHFQLNISGIPNISNEALLELPNRLPPRLQTLGLNLVCEKHYREYTERYGNHLQALAAVIPSSLTEFTLTTSLLQKDDKKGVIDLMKSMPRGLNKLDLSLYWPGFDVECLEEMAACLPRSIQEISLSFHFAKHVEGDELMGFAKICQRFTKLKEFKLYTHDNRCDGYYKIHDINTIGELMECAGLEEVDHYWLCCRRFSFHRSASETEENPVVEEDVVEEEAEEENEATLTPMNVDDEIDANRTPPDSVDELEDPKIELLDDIIEEEGVEEAVEEKAYKCCGVGVY